MAIIQRPTQYTIASDLDIVRSTFSSYLNQPLTENKIESLESALTAINRLSAFMQKKLCSAKTLHRNYTVAQRVAFAASILCLGAVIPTSIYCRLIFRFIPYGFGVISAFALRFFDQKIFRPKENTLGTVEVLEQYTHDDTVLKTYQKTFEDVLICTRLGAGLPAIKESSRFTVDIPEFKNVRPHTLFKSTKVHPVSSHRGAGQALNLETHSSSRRPKSAFTLFKPPTPQQPSTLYRITNLVCDNLNNNNLPHPYALYEMTRSSYPDELTGALLNRYTPKLIHPYHHTQHSAKYNALYKRHQLSDVVSLYHSNVVAKTSRLVEISKREISTNVKTNCNRESFMTLVTGLGLTGFAMLIDKNIPILCLFTVGLISCICLSIISRQRTERALSEVKKLENKVAKHASAKTSQTLFEQARKFGNTYPKVTV